MKYSPLLLLVLTMTSCRVATPLPHTIVTDPYLTGKCFPPDRHDAFRVVHAITATIRGKSSSFIGVTVADVPADRIRATLLSVEGLVLLDAVDDKGSITVYRAMQPFTSARFARGLFDDIELLFFPPRGDLTGARIGANGTVTCTWVDHDHIFKKNAFPSGETVIKEYDSDHRDMRRVKLSPPIIKGFYRHIRMDSYGLGGYSLSFDLLEGEPLEQEDGLFSQ
ncbi:MAG: hypothetical protein M1491_05290 [Deltaproteobacteria bacterium]|nr:hypothetical protein [Deltaproteobacteria bacterium]MCL5278090.1 hypothetical protein [Deltaproteobacteria bacterium]